MTVHKAKAKQTTRASAKTPAATHATKAKVKAILSDVSYPPARESPSRWALEQAANDLASGWNVTSWNNGMVTAHGIGYSGDTAVPDDRTMTREAFIQMRAEDHDWQSGASLRELESHGYR